MQYQLAVPAGTHICTPGSTMHDMRLVQHVPNRGLFEEISCCTGYPMPNHCPMFFLSAQCLHAQQLLGHSHGLKPMLCAVRCPSALFTVLLVALDNEQDRHGQQSL